MNQLCKKAIESVQDVISFAELNQQTNELWFLDFLDKLNELSVKY